LGEIEGVMREYGGVEDAVVVLRQEPGVGQRLVGYVLSGEELEVGELREYVRSRLPEYMVPGVMVRLEEMPRTGSGKIDRKALPAPERATFSSESEFISPRNKLEEQLALIWEDVLNVKPISMTDNFFELGGHSFLAVRLVARIEKESGKHIALANLFQHPTIEQLATFIEKQLEIDKWSPLIKLQPQGAKRPFFCVHPVGGHVVCYAELARQLGDDRPFIGIQAQGLDGKMTPHTRIEAMASYYISVLRDIQPQGPYLLGGWSMGGVVAFEMARQLREQGQSISLLAMIDSKAPSDELPKMDELAILYEFAFALGLPSNQLDFSTDELEQLPLEEQLGYLALNGNNKEQPGIGIAEFRRIFNVIKTNIKAVYHYTPKKFDGQILYFEASESINKKETDMGNLLREFFLRPRRSMSQLSPEQENEWGNWASQGIDIRMVPGTHHTMVFEPGVKVLAEQLKVAIDKAEAQEKL
jgi:thioesterase domain-containing protein/acyl carrier protein